MVIQDLFKAYQNFEKNMLNGKGTPETFKCFMAGAASVLIELEGESAAMLDKIEGKKPNKQN